MATPNIVPRATGEGGLGTAAKGWGGAFVTNKTASSTTQGGKLVLAADDGAVMASGHRLGILEFSGAEDTSNTISVGASIAALTDNTWSGSVNDASLAFYTTKGTTISKPFSITSDMTSLFQSEHTTALSNPYTVKIDSNTSGDAAQDSTGLFIDFDRTVAGSDTAAHNDIGVNLDVNSASLGTSTVVGMDIDVVGATSGTSVATGIQIDTSGADKNYHLVLGSDADGADRTMVFGHSTLKTVIGIDDDQDVFAINTDADFEADNDLEIDASGNVICRNGSITGANYRTIWVDAGSMVPTVTNGATAGTEEVTNTFDFFAFDTTTAERVQFKIVMPEQWDVSADLKAKFYFLPTSTDTGTVQFSIAGTSLDTGDIISTAMGTAAVHTPLAANGTDNDVHITAATAACTIAGVSNAHEIVLFEITRVTGTDTFTGDAHLLGVNLQYKEKPAAESAW